MNSFEFGTQHVFMCMHWETNANPNKCIDDVIWQMITSMSVCMTTDLHKTHFIVAFSVPLHPWSLSEHGSKHYPRDSFHKRKMDVC